MIVKQTPRLATSTRAATALLASSAVFFAGCSNMASTAPAVTGSDSGATASVTIGGKVHGGIQPVTNAKVNLWFAGQKGGAAASIAAATTSGSDGTFSFVRDAAGTTESGTNNHYSCPADNPLVYVTATGGNTQNNGDANQKNSAAAFIGVYGMCGSDASNTISTQFITLSEVTTVATMAVVHQFFDPATETLSWDGTGQQGNLVPFVPETIALLADVTDGTAVTSTTLGSGPTVTATPDTGKINLLADILAACINTADSSQPACSALFANAPAPQPKATQDNPTSGFVTATDTLQALYYILTNPTNSTAQNLSNLFNLPPGVAAPFQPTLPSVPTDWNIAITYSSSSTCSNGGGFISSPTEINIDAKDNVWITNGGAAGTFSMLGTNGTPAYCASFGGNITAGGVVDDNGYSWLAVGTSIYRYHFFYGTTQFPLTAVGSPTPIAVAVDGAGNVFFTSTDGTTGTAYEIPAAAPFGAPIASAIAPVKIATGLGPNPIHIMPDNSHGGGNGNVWISSGGGYITELVWSGTGTSYTPTNLSTGGTNAYGLVVGGYGNNIYTSDYVSGAITIFGNSSSTSGQVSSYTGASAAGIASPTTLLVDGVGNAWLADNANTTSGSNTFGSISAVTNAPVALSPSTGFQRSSGTLSSSRALAIDQQGNVWVGGDGDTFVTEFVGAAVPIFQPYSLGMIQASGRYFQNIP